MDTNVLVQLVTEEDKAQSRRARALFEQASEGNLEVVIGPPVLFELAWVLKKGFGRSRNEVLETLVLLVGHPGVRLLDENEVYLALTLAESHNVSFADAYIAASVQASGCDAIATFNTRDFETLPVPLYAF